MKCLLMCRGRGELKGIFNGLVTANVQKFLKFAYDVVRVCMGKMYSLLVRGVSRSKRLIPLILSQSGWMLLLQ